ncbi:TlpA disulfide reductase family protein [Sphingobacterium multivorum]|uniref:TlpA disulfide reductase family protein n=1 Tax=Sphingobacterium multivorum TaxID=28454 RepID=UPI0028ACE069|nr:TlpA disulfide reductase family protein [Sphingobacterium multivorum]
MRLIYLNLLLFIASCTPTIAPKDSVYIGGNIKNLSPGTVYLLNSKREAIDSVYVKDGKFSFSLQRDPENDFYTLSHIDDIGMKSIFQFPTDSTFRGGPLQVDFFMADDTVKLGGNLKVFHSRQIKMADNIQLVYPDEPLSAGKQTRAMYSVKWDLNNRITDSAFVFIQQQVKEYPYSIYLLKQILENRANFSVRQLQLLLPLFDEDMQQRKEAVEIKASILNRQVSSGKIVSFELKSVDGGVKRIINRNSTVNILVFWASWCGPCLQEIPDMKKLYQKYKDENKVHWVSVSLDRNELAWKKSLEENNMPWEQFIVPSEKMNFLYDILELDGSIPAVLFVNNQGKIINKLIGYDKGNIKCYDKIILENLAKNY